MQKTIKYNPSFLTEEELIESFVVREKELKSLIDIISNNQKMANQHVLVMGARGSGKTTLLRRVRAEIHRSEELNKVWFPISFGEESYEISSAGQFWLEALYYLGIETNDSEWTVIYKELLQELDEKRLEQRCLAQLVSFAEKHNKRLVLMIENLDLVFGEQLSSKDGWALRNVLMSQEKIMLLASSVTSFDAITNKEQAMYELFRVIKLDRLSIEECQSVWKRVAQNEITSEQARAIQILTGGNPRLLTVLAIFGADRSFNSLLEDLSLLVDDHTDYFKSNFEQLPATERKVFACLATLWQDSTAAEVGVVARMSTSKVSALLKRLVSRGVVEVLGGRKKRYQLSERLYNIYYLMRRGHENQRVHAVVNFMLAFYGNERFHEALQDIASEVCSTEAQKRKYLYTALEYMLERPEMEKYIEAGFELPNELLKQNDLPLMIKSFPIQNFDLDKAFSEENWQGIFNFLNDILTLNIRIEDSDSFYKLLNIALSNMGEDRKLIEYLEKSVEENPSFAYGWSQLGDLYLNKANNIYKAVFCTKQALKLTPEDGSLWFQLGMAYISYTGRKLDQTNKTSKWYLKLVRGLDQKIKESFKEAVRLSPENDFYLASLAFVLVGDTDTQEQSIELINQALAFNDDASNNRVAMCIYTVMKDISNTLFYVEKYTNLLIYPVDTIDSLLRPFYFLVESGQGKELLAILEESANSHLLETLIVALKIFLKIEVQAPQEIREIVNDILAKIKDQKQF